MSGGPRKVKNPLLSAAGEGFPFDNYPENALFVPVTPVTPAILHADAELDSFVGQEPVNSNNSTLSTNSAEAEGEFTPIPLNSEENASPVTQPVKQGGYLTSILSSLPNLSLSTITGETSGSQTNRTQDPSVISQSTIPLQEGRDTLRHTPPPIVPNFHDPRTTNFPSSVENNIGSSGPLPVPPQPTLPPTSTTGPISYRLGNQRRLKYAPPPDLTSSSSKQYSTPVVPPPFVAQSSTTPTIFNPSELVSPAQNYQPVPLTQNYSSVTSTQNYQSVPLSQSHQPFPPTQSYQPTPFADNYQSLIQNSRPIPSAQIQKPLSQTYQSVPPSQTYQSLIQNDQSNSNKSPDQAHQLASVYQPVSLTQSDQKPPQAHGPVSSTQSTPPVATSSTGSPSLQCSTPESSPSLPKPVKSNPPSVPHNSTVASERATPSIESVPLSTVQLPEPLTSQNTPTFFNPNSQREPSLLEKEATVSSTHLDSISKDNVTQSTTEPKPAVTFAPVSAIQVSEKLEHLLAEQTDPSLKHERNEAERIESIDLDRANTDKTDLLKSDSAFETSEANSEEKTDVSQSHGTSTVQQYFTSSSSLFPEKEERPQINYPATTTEAFAGFPHSFTHSTSSFFNAPKAATTFPVFSSAGNDLQQVPLVTPAPFAGSNYSRDFNRVPTATSATCSSTQQPPFYNPMQFQSETSKYSSSSYFYSPPVAQPASNNIQYYFDGSTGFHQAQDLAGGIGNVFPPASVVMTSVPEPTGSATLNPVQMSINPLGGRTTTDGVVSSFPSPTAGVPDKRMQYRAVYHHWFYRKEVENKVIWHPFSMQDSLRLEEVHNSTEITPETTVATDGGRYDVDILRRQRSPVYWTGPSMEVRRCSWFYKAPTESRYVPYDESTAAKLEEEYKQACLVNNWNRRIDLNNGEYIVFHSATVQVHYLTPNSPELAASWGNATGTGSRPRVIKRGLDDFHIEEGEPERVDHLLFLVHGIGSVCDLKFRTVEEVVDEFRSISLQLVQSHYRTASEQKVVNRIEVLPISWHTTLHSEDTGIDKKLQAITLESIPKLRHFTNDTLLDILFYTSPVYCQTIMQTVGSEMNRLYTVFKDRNPDFDGGVYLGGHSLGSLILFDLLCHQKPRSKDKSVVNEGEASEDPNEDAEASGAVQDRVLKRRLSKKISYVVGSAGTGQPYIHYPQLSFHPRAFFALGSPIGMFVTVRGIDMLGEDFTLPTCPAFFNIFHPFDPVAYRVEALINPEAHKYRPMLIPHHKGRKRMHLELKETMARVGADLKQKVIDSVRNTWNSVYQLALFHRSDNSTLEQEIDKVVEEQLQQTPPVTEQQNNDDGGAEFKVGKLNNGRRVDYVLQEAPFEYINEYIFALTSHVCYWESEDTMLMILKEIYGSAGIQTDAQLPQQTLSIERASPASSMISSTSTASRCDSRSYGPVVGMDPTAPILEKSVGPPPKTGFVRK